MEEYSIEHTTSSPHHHQSNGLAERGIETVETLWRKEKDKLKALLAYRTTPLESLARPDTLMMGRTIGNDIPFMNRRHNEESDFRQRDTALKERQRRDYN